MKATLLYGAMYTGCVLSVGIALDILVYFTIGDAIYGDFQVRHPVVNAIVLYVSAAIIFALFAAPRERRRGSVLGYAAQMFLVYAVCAFIFNASEVVLTYDAALSELNYVNFFEALAVGYTTLAAALYFTARN